MGLAVVALVGAVALGLATGGSWSGLAALPLRRRRYVLAAVAAQLLGVGAGALSLAPQRPAYVVGLTASAAFALAFTVVNRDVAGVPLITLGLCLNALVVGLNGAMPVSLWAAEQAGVSVRDVLLGDDPRHEVAGGETLLRPLGDVVPVRLPLRPEVVSPGDVLVAAGMGQLVTTGLRRRPRDRRDAGAATPPTPS